MAQAVRYRATAQLRFNIKSYLDREFVNSGLFLNVPSGTRDPVSLTDISLLTPTSPTLYESHFNNWLYETDASGVSSFPTIHASGVYIDGVFHATGSAPYEPEIDFARGRVFFGADVPSASEVRADFTHKNVVVDFVDSQAANLVFSRFKDSIDYSENILPSGTDRQLPVVVIDPQRRIPTPHALGGAIQVDQQIVFHILSNSFHEQEQIVDILTETSFRKAFPAVDFNKVPLLFTDKGDKASTYKNYTDLQNDVSLRFTKLFVDEARVIENMERLGVHYTRVHWNVIFYERRAG